MAKISQDIKNGSFERIYLLYGPENFLKRSYKNQLKAALTRGDDMNFASFEGKGISFEEVRSLAETLPFFAERRCILLEETGLFKGSSEEWAAWLPQVPETTTLIFVENEVDKRSRMYKAAAANGCCEPCERRKPQELADWAVRYLGRAGRRISRAALEQLMVCAGEDMENLHSEMEKLIAYAGEQTDITEDVVSAICTQQVTGQVFQMVDAVAAGNEREALDRYYDLLALREPSMRILFLIARQFNQLMQVKMLTGQGLRQREVAEELKLRPFVAGKLIRQAGSFSERQLTGYVELCVSSEEAVKTGRISDQLAVELVILTIARRNFRQEKRQNG